MQRSRALRLGILLSAIALLTVLFQTPAMATVRADQATTQKTALQALREPTLTSAPNLKPMETRLRFLTPKSAPVGGYLCEGWGCVEDFLRGWWGAVDALNLSADDIDTCCTDLSFHFPKTMSQGLNLMQDSGIYAPVYWGLMGWAICSSLSHAASAITTPVGGIVVGGICSLEIGLAMYRLHEAVDEAEANGTCLTFMVFYNTNFDGDFGTAPCRR